MSLPFFPQPKPDSRLKETTEARKLTLVNEREFRAIVWRRDGGCCRMCSRKVKKTLARIPERGEVHHLHGRTGDLQFDDHHAILVCLTCHEKLTGRINERWMAVQAHPKLRVFINGHWLIDARQPIAFERVA